MTFSNTPHQQFWKGSTGFGRLCILAPVGVLMLCFPSMTLYDLNYLAPLPILMNFDAEHQKIVELQEENAKLQEQVIKLTDQVAKYEDQMGRLQEQVCLSICKFSSNQRFCK